MDYPLSIPGQLRQQLRSLRKQRGLTQVGLARLLGVVQSRVADIEANPGAVSVEQLMKVLNALNVQIVIRDGGPSSSRTKAASGIQSGSGVPSPTRVRPIGTRRHSEDNPKGEW